MDLVLRLIVVLSLLYTDLLNNPIQMREERLKCMSRRDNHMHYTKTNVLETNQIHANRRTSMYKSLANEHHSVGRYVPMNF